MQAYQRVERIEAARIAEIYTPLLQAGPALVRTDDGETLAVDLVAGEPLPLDPVLVRTDDGFAIKGGEFLAGFSPA